MKIVVNARVDPDVMRVTSAGGRMPTAFGLWFLTLGLCACAAALAKLFGVAAGWTELTIHVGATIALGGAIGALFTMGGAVLAFLRSGATFDRRHGRVVKWSRFLGWKAKQFYRLRDFARIAVERYWNSNKIGPDWYYRVVLEGADRKTIELGSQLRVELARKRASQVGEFVGLSIDDRTMTDVAP